MLAQRRNDSTDVGQRWLNVHCCLVQAHHNMPLLSLKQRSHYGVFMNVTTVGIPW